MVSVLLNQFFWFTCNYLKNEKNNFKLKKNYKMINKHYLLFQNFLNYLRLVALLILLERNRQWFRIYTSNFQSSLESSIDTIIIGFGILNFSGKTQQHICNPIMIETTTNKKVASTYMTKFAGGFSFRVTRISTHKKHNVKVFDFETKNSVRLFEA